MLIVIPRKLQATFVYFVIWNEMHILA